MEDVDIEPDPGWPRISVDGHVTSALNALQIGGQRAFISLILQHSIGFLDSIDIFNASRYSSLHRYPILPTGII